MNKRGSSIFWGSVFVLGAIFIIASSLGFLGHPNMMTVILSIGLGAIIIRSILSLSFAGILIPAAFLCILYDEQWGITNLTPWPVILTAILGSIGFSLIFKKNKHYLWKHYSHGNNQLHKKAPDTEEINGEKIEIVCRFGSSSKYVNSDNFQNAELRCEFGAMKVYFDNAIIQGEYADIHIFSSFSGLEIYLPRNWKIENHTDNTFGGMDEHSRPRPNEYDKILRVYGNINFSGVEIFYV